MCWQSGRDVADNDKVLSTKFADVTSFRYVACRVGASEF